jgi:hypothetical protein
MIKRFFIVFSGLVLAGVSLGIDTECSIKATGPTLKMEYSNQGQGNDVDAFMYFIPLIMPTSISVYTDPNTTLNAKIISRTSKGTSSTFTTTCIFEVCGQGIYEALADPNEIIAFSSKNEPKDKILRNQLHSIRVDGPMRGSLVISGCIKGAQRQVDTLQIRFDLDGKSPVAATLFEVKPVDGKYNYEDRFNEQIARINTLSFTRGSNPPTMEAEVSSIARSNAKEGFIASLKAMVANWFLPPVPVTVIGNQTMLDFGAALDSTQTAFTFPYAENLRQSVKTLLAKAGYQPTNAPN